jgi:hypothetical protein
MGASASALLGLLPNLISPAHANPPVNEIKLNSSNVQIVHVGLNNDVINMSLNVTSTGDSGDCEGGDDDLLETGVHVSVSVFSCAQYALFCAGIGCQPFDFDAQVNYVEHDIGSFSYGTSFAANKAGNVSSKIVAAATTPPNTCGTWTINLQGTGQDFSEITGTSVSLFLNDSDNDGNGLIDGGAGAQCFDVNANVGNGITKPHRGVHRARR